MVANPRDVGGSGEWALAWAQLYPRLLRRAGRLLSRSPILGYYPEDLVQDTFLKIHGGKSPLRCQHEISSLLVLACVTMKNVLEDQRRHGNAAKRGGGRVRLPLDRCAEPCAPRTFDLIEMREIHVKIAREAPEAGHVGELKVFCGMTIAEIAGVDGLPVKKVKVQWGDYQFRFSRYWVGAA